MAHKLTTTDSSTMVVNKPVGVVVLIPKIGGLTPMARKMFNIMLHRTLQEIKNFKGNSKEVPATHLFSMPLSELIKPIKSGKSRIDALAKSYLFEMYETSLEFEAPDVASSKFGEAHLLSEVGANMVEGRLTFFWSFPPTIMKMLESPVMYSQVPIEQLVKLSSYEALALYDICCRYKTSHAKKTSIKPPQWWVKALTSKVPKPDPLTGEIKWREWRKVLESKVKNAIQEINEKTDLTIELDQTTSGKKVTAVQFMVYQKSGEVEADPTPKISTETLEQATRIGLKVPEINSMLRFGESESVIRASMTKMETRDPATIQNKQGYFKKIVSEVGGQTSSSPKVASPGTQSVVSAPKTQDQNIPLAMSPIQELRATAKDELLNLSFEKQKEYSITALTSLKNRGMANASVIQKVGSGNWKSAPLVQAAMIDLYAAEHFVERWTEALENSK